MKNEVVAEFIRNIAKEYKFKNIVEVGVGYNYSVALSLREFNIFVVDINENAIKKARMMGLKGYVDDVFNPNIYIYKNVDLIYSIRPPIELQLAILELAKIVNCKVIIRPMYNEPPLELKLKNYKGEIFYLSF
ncbi:hypothetical protein J422_05549 [Methanocaldococcus villosus KIN24-T80]|uniref:UPF0146 protein J422_05549 n=1 Tax=Methanocaldococcus villosus KIN24-T80 TaxID=1069083 RepID=N6VRS2_9EURY|nr:UPF0146 family protein [Methanocaldococcus villosus]ENN95861.1 hypothetical protein J422_05549 [Methanocaldococcus villosus KIN24-T80]